MDELNAIVDACRARLDEKNSQREALLNLSRVLTRHCGNAIRAMHRQEWDQAQQTLDLAREVVGQFQRSADAHPDLYYAGYSQDALKEYVEATATYSLVRGEALPTPDSLGIDPPTYLNGLCEAASELRRYILDIIRDDHSEQAEHLMERMESIYDMLVTVDYTDAISGGLRHRTDQLRGVLERTRGDVTMSMRQQRLEKALKQSEDKSYRPPVAKPDSGSV
ncbi:MAG: haloacid dehalogenase [Anaerolineae bacterium]|nr:haloacid dehalogenase [Anaerolineae bacterium]